MHIGLIGGIGPAATDFYYRGLIDRVRELGSELDATIVHASAQTLVKNFTARDPHTQAKIFAGLVERLKAAGADVAAVTSIGGHYCINELKPLSALPLINMVETVNAWAATCGFERVGLIGTDTVMQTRFYHGVHGVEIVVPDADELALVHQHYVEMAVPGVVTEANREVFFTAGRKLIEDQGAKTVLLGGTDLFLAFQDRDPGYPVVDCAEIHIEALAQAAVA